MKKDPRLYMAKNLSPKELIFQAITRDGIRPWIMTVEYLTEYDYSGHRSNIFQLLLKYQNL